MTLNQFGYKGRLPSYKEAPVTNLGSLPIHWMSLHRLQKKMDFLFQMTKHQLVCARKQIKMCQSCNVVLDVSIQYNTCNVEAQGRIWFCLRAYLSLIILCFNHGGYKAVHKSIYPPWYIHICKCCCARFNVLNSGNRSMNLCYWLLFYKTL